MTADPGRIAVALVGLRGSGKSTLAPRVAATLGWPSFDADDALAARVGEPAGAYLARAGEATFRRVEAEVVAALLEPAAGRPRVVALGGGAVTSAAVRRVLAAPDVFVVHLEASPDVLAARITAPGTPARPPLTAADDPVGELRELAERRREFFAEVADFALETTAANVDACCERIVAKIRDT